jgi:predicted RNase H-like nuclease
MKNILITLLFLVLTNCKSAADKTSKNSLYEVLTQQESGGASIRFFEILSEEKEIQMLLSDDNLKNKIKTSDLKTSNFVILNLGEKSTGGYSIQIQQVEETASNIVIYIKEIVPDKASPVTDALTNPYTIVKINSKKEIIFK